MPVELFEAVVREHAARRAAGDEPLARRRPPRTARPGRCYNADGKIAEPVLDDLAGAGYWGLLVDRQYGGYGAPLRSFMPFLTQMALVDPTIAGLASVHGCIGAVDPVRTFGSEEQKQRFLPKLASGERLSAFALTEPCAGSDLTALRHAGPARRRPVPRQRREAVHHQRRSRPHDRPGLPDRRQAGRADRRSAAAGERAVPAREVRPVRPQAHVQPRHRSSRTFPVPAENLLQVPQGQRPDDRLSRPEPGPRRPVCQRRRQHAADDGQHDSLGQLPRDLRRSDRQARAGPPPPGPAGRADRRLRRARRLVLDAARSGLSRRDGVHHRQDLWQRSRRRKRRSSCS